MNARRYLRLLEITHNNPYFVDSTTGTIISTKGKPMQPYLVNGYEKLKLSYKGKSYSYRVHELVAFVEGYDLIDKTVNHKDGDKRNNQATNLECITMAENLRHAKELGLMKNIKREKREVSKSQQRKK